MLKFFLGAILGGTLEYVTERPFLSAGVLAVLGIFSQVMFARGLYAYLGGQDPVQTYGARSLKQLKKFVAVPSSIQFADLLAKSCGWAVLAVGVIWIQSPPYLTVEEKENLRSFAQAIQENRLAIRAFNKALGSGTGVVTIPKDVADDLIQRYEKALELSRRAKGEFLARVDPELDNMVRDHFEKHLELSIESLRTGSPWASFEAQRHQNMFADWWDSHRKNMPMLTRVMKGIESTSN
jgi:hypothetical protein